MAKDRESLSCELVGGRIVMSIGSQVLASAAAHHPDYWDPERRPDGPNIIVTNARVFAREVVAAINDEDEEGGTLLSRMLDRAMAEAVESGCEGVDHGD